SPEQQARLFQPFAQAEGDTTRRYGGTGLGLAISRRLADLMGGSVTLDSSLGQGTTLQLRLALPRAAVEDIVVDPSLASGGGFAARSAPSIARAESERSLVLLVDDHPTNRMVIARQLALAGYATVPATDGQQGLALWRTGRFALVLSDVHMPLLDGYALARTIREEEARNGLARTPIVALTASALKGEGERCKEAGMDDYLAKPVGIATLAATMQRWLPHTAPPGQSANDPDDAAQAGKRVATRDWSVLEALTGSDTAITRALLDDFFASLTEDLRVLESAVAAQDLPTLTRQAHLRGAACLIGADEMAAVAHHLEAAGRSGELNRASLLSGQLLATAGTLRRHVEDAFGA
ncbi:MAG: hypothetical protein JWL98_1028, partial [Xanthomonadaceae bacterium]|nr:hypothetical protein [Xanthomonadaceae bacterium]